MELRTHRHKAGAIVAAIAGIALGLAVDNSFDRAGASVDPGTGDVVGEFTYGVTPARLLDTRPGTYTVDNQYVGTGALSDMTPMTVQVAGRGGVPLDATSVLLNVTAVQPAAEGFVSVWPSGPFPGTSNLNFRAGDVVPNMVFTPLANGSITVMASSGRPHVLIDVAAYSSDQPAAA
ncbi:MAG: hypothetical protein IT196_10705 [Acidimicrobiales bacterium]|nr:hypothetical protein [Acidimicrobiales bacterium]